VHDGFQASAYRGIRDGKFNVIKFHDTVDQISHVHLAGCYEVKRRLVLLLACPGAAGNDQLPLMDVVSVESDPRTVHGKSPEEVDVSAGCGELKGAPLGLRRGTGNYDRVHSNSAPVRSITASK